MVNFLPEARVGVEIIAQILPYWKRRRIVKEKGRIFTDAIDFYKSVCIISTKEVYLKVEKKQIKWDKRLSCFNV